MPQALHEDELVGGNGLVEMGTLLVIPGRHHRCRDRRCVVHPLRADRGGGDCRRGGAGLPGQPQHSTSSGVYAATAPGLDIFTQSWATLRMGLGQTPAVSRSIVGNSWFWLSAPIYLTPDPGLRQGMVVRR